MGCDHGGFGPHEAPELFSGGVVSRVTAEDIDGMLLFKERYPFDRGRVFLATDISDNDSLVGINHSGWLYSYRRFDEVEPITSAARDMLAIAKRGRK
jgi:hypothetical protein